MFTIMAVSSLATLFILPAIVSLKQEWMFDQNQKGATCKCSQCMLIALFVALAIAYILFGYTTVGWKPITFAAIGIVVLFAGICNFLSKRKICLTEDK